MKNDIPEKGAIVQREKETFAVAPHIPGGIIDPVKLRNFAYVAETPRLGNLIADELSENESLDFIDGIISFYKKTNQKKRLGKIIDEIGLDNFKKEVL